jgi:predicted hotdog family 3-hydroxylacyl-ACP dehydratase
MDIPAKILLQDEQLIAVIPQKPPMVMIDKLFYCDDTTTITGLTVKKDNIFFENGKLQEPALTENIAQTAAARAGYFFMEKSKADTNAEPPIGFIGAIKDMQFFSLPKEGDELITTVTVKNEIFGITLIEGEVKCNGEVIASCEMKIGLK